MGSLAGFDATELTSHDYPTSFAVGSLAGFDATELFIATTLRGGVTDFRFAPAQDRLEGAENVLALNTQIAGLVHGLLGLLFFRFPVAVRRMVSLGYTGPHIGQYDLAAPII